MEEDSREQERKRKGVAALAEAVPKVGPRPGLGMLTGGDGGGGGAGTRQKALVPRLSSPSQACRLYLPSPTQDPSPRHLLPPLPAWRSQSGTMGFSPSTVYTLCHPADLAQGLLPCSPPVPTQQSRLAQVSLSQKPESSRGQQREHRLSSHRALF